MANNRRDYSYYVDGSAARKIEQIPQRTRDMIPEREYDYEEERAIRKSVKQKKRHNILSVCAFLLAIFASLYLCVSYVMVYSDIEATSKEITALERQIDKLKSSNEIEYAQIDSSVDLKKVYKRATKQLGMVPATSNQVYSYDNMKSDRVIQYGNIPE